MTVDPKLVEATRCLLAFRTADGPQLVSMPCWSDGGALWMAPRAATPVVEALRHAPDCAVGIGDGSGLAATGTARVFALDDLVGLLIHGPVITAAMTALAVHHPREVVRGWLSIRRRVAVRVAIGEVCAIDPTPPLPPGIAPALPEVVPADVRRHLSGARHVIVAGDGPSGLHLGAATWSAGFILNGDLHARPGHRIAVAVEVDGVGIVLSGELDARHALQPARVSWWQGGRSGTAALPTAPRGVVGLPD